MHKPFTYNISLKGIQDSDLIKSMTNPTPSTQILENTKKFIIDRKATNVNNMTQPFINMHILLDKREDILGRNLTNVKNKSFNNFSNVTQHHRNPSGCALCIKRIWKMLYKYSS
jgi:hypothetical protein